MTYAALRTWLAAALYGYALGAAHSDVYAARNLVKFPLLITVTTALCALSYWIVARVLAAPLSFLAVQRLAWQLFHDTAIMLASLAPVFLFVGRVLRATDDGELGEYDSFFAQNVIAVAVAGSLALVRQAHSLLREHTLSRLRASLLVVAWLTLSLGVGGQAAFFMRPFFGFPATRGGNPPFFLGATPDLRGATNFYESAWQAIARPPLPLPRREAPR